MILAVLLGCGPCECPPAPPLDLVFPSPGDAAPVTVHPVFEPEAAGFVGGLVLLDGAGAEVPVSAQVISDGAATLIEVRPVAPLAAGEPYSLVGDGADGPLEITWFVAEWMPVTTPTASFRGAVHARPDMPRDCEWEGEVLDLEFETDAVWLAVEVMERDPWSGRDFIQLASADGTTIDTCRIGRRDFDGPGAEVRVQPFGADGAGGGWTLPELIPRSAE